MTTKPESWNVMRLRALRREALPSDPMIVRVPRYQRGVVWSTDKQADLIDSMLSGYPVGALLMALTGHEPAGSEGPLVPAYNLIDGLQRTDSILDYLDEPLTRAPVDHVSDELVAEFLPELIAHCAEPATEVTASSVRAAIVSWMRATRKLDPTSGFSPIALITAIATAHASTPDFAALDGPANTFMAKLKAAISIEHVDLPVLLYEGPVESLPEVFRRLNSQGTPLTKYQVFAAAWTGDETHIASAEVREQISRRYKALRGEYELADVDPDNLGPTASLFDYLTGLGAVLAGDAPLLFAEGDPEDVQSIAFSLATLVQGRRLGDMARLPTYLASGDGSPIDISSLETAMRWGTEFVESALRPFLGLKLNRQRAGKGAHSELQIVSMIASAIVSRYDPSSWVEREDWPARELRLKVALPQAYVVDITRRQWRGALYTLAYERVWGAREPDDSAMTPGEHYAEAVPRSRMENELELWWSDQRSKKQRDRQRVSAADQVMLKVIFSRVLLVADHEAHKFDIDHLFPVARLKTAIGGEGEGWPMSAIGNLALIRSDLNKRKSAQTVPDFLAAVAASNDLDLKNAAESLTAALFVEPAEFGIGEGFNKEQYLAAIDNRWNLLKARLVEGLNCQDEAP